MIGREDRSLLEKIAFLIEATDSYRVGRNVDFRKVERAIEELSPSLANLLDASTRKKYRKTVDFIINLPIRSKEARLWSSIYMITRFLLRVALLGFLLSLGLLFYKSPLAELVLWASSSMLFISLVIRWYALVKIFEFYEHEMKNQQGKDDFLKELAQELINSLRERMRELKVNPRKLRLHLFKDDYTGLRVVKRPGWLRDYYLAEVEI
ncbi:MAG: hypothetical protein NZ992_05930 [Candidatus Korarchaeum sp.]|nr:hypothetical protein [Candidatus Korarchaeum sp.]MDW8035607.1 hypothetical protein [Candidatus Korarchaeum sp.]